jgi:hypothetical protein
MFERCNLSDVYIKLGQLERGKALLDETQPFFTEQKQPIPLFYLITQRIEVALEEGRIADAIDTMIFNFTRLVIIRCFGVIRHAACD